MMCRIAVCNSFYFDSSSFLKKSEVTVTSWKIFEEASRFTDRIFMLSVLLLLWAIKSWPATVYNINCDRCSRFSVSYTSDTFEYYGHWILVFVNVVYRSSYCPNVFTTHFVRFSRKFLTSGNPVFDLLIFNVILKSVDVSQYQLEGMSGNETCRLSFVYITLYA